MKRTIIASLATISLAASLAACGSGSESTASSEATTQTAAAQASMTENTTTENTTRSSSSKETPVPVSNVLTYTVPAGLSEENGSEGAVALTGADANGNLVAISLAAVTSDQDAEAAVKALSAAGGVLSSSAQTSAGDVTFSEGGAMTVAGETGFSWTTQTTLSSGGSQAVRGVYVTHNGHLVQIGYMVTNLTGTAEVSDADFQAFLDSIAWV